MDTSTQKRERPGLVLAFLAGVLVLLLAFSLLLARFVGGARTLRAEAYAPGPPPGFHFTLEGRREGQRLVLTGWAIVEDEYIDRVENRVVLYDTQRDKYLALPTQMEDRADVLELYGDRCRYGWGGFLAMGPPGQFWPEAGRYRVFFAYATNGHKNLIDTGLSLEEVLHGA